MALLVYALFTLLLAALTTFVVVGLIHFSLRPRYWLRTWTAYLKKNGWALIWYTKYQRVTPLARFASLGLHQLAGHLESWGLFRLLAIVSHISIVFAVIVFIQDLEVRKEEREARAWSLIYQAKKSPGDGGRRYALQYLNNEKKANLASLPLANAYLVSVKLPEAKLQKADLREAALREADLRKADLRKADLCEADLRGADLYEADLQKADLYEADLREAALRWANLHEANLIWANLHEANLSGADLRGAKYLTQKQIDEAFFCNFWAMEEPPKLSAELRPPRARKCDMDRNPIEE